MDVGRSAWSTLLPPPSFPSRLGPLSTAPSSTSECRFEFLPLASLPSTSVSLLCSLPDLPSRLRLPLARRCFIFLNGFKKFRGSMPVRGRRGWLSTWQVAGLVTFIRSSTSVKRPNNTSPISPLHKQEHRSPIASRSRLRTGTRSDCTFVPVFFYRLLVYQYLQPHIFYRWAPRRACTSAVTQITQPPTSRARPSPTLKIFNPAGFRHHQDSRGRARRPPEPSQNTVCRDRCAPE